MTSSEPSSAWQRRPAPDAKLPDYAHPPLVQVSLGVGFGVSVPSPSDSQLAAFARELGETWRAEDSPRGKVICGRWETPLHDQRIVLSTRGLTYVWDGQAGDLYPHYPLVREGFVAVWNAWCRTNDSPATVTGWSVDYVNRIPQGTVWTSLGDCSFLKWLCPLPGLDGLSAPNLIEHSWEFALDRYQAALSVTLDTGDELPDPAEPDNLWLRLSMNGRLADPDDTFLAGFDYGREVIVRTFRQLMQPAANEFWGLKP